MRLSLDFALPPGRHFEVEAAAGYYLDFASKAPVPTWPPPGQPVIGDGRPRLFVALIQFGLGCFERHLHGHGEHWLHAARDVGERLLALQTNGAGAHAGAWLHEVPLHHTYDLEPPWISAMAQGEGASLLVRLHRELGDERFAQAAQRALQPMGVDSRRGGVLAPIDGGALPEEYPTTPPSHVLNGAIFALWGLRDVAVALGDERARADFAAGAETLARALPRWDTGRWSRYDLFPHRLPNVASFAYHALHIDQLGMMARVLPHPEFSAVRDRFLAYRASRVRGGEAFLRKAAFRLLVPRRRSAPMQPAPGQP